MAEGSITRRGERSWRLKFEAGPRDAAGRRQTRYATIRGTKKDAERELRRLLSDIDGGTYVDPAKTTIAEWVRQWLAGANGLSRKTAERYGQLAEQQIVPHLGNIVMQKLRPAHVAAWHDTLRTSGGAAGRPLSARTVGHAHRVLHTALARAAKLEIVSRNVASVVKPPKVEAEEVEILGAEQVVAVLSKLVGHRLYPVVVLALGTGLRRGELCALRWGDVDLDGAVLRVERAVEQTKAGLRIKGPKSRHGRRSISLPTAVVDALRAHRVEQLQQRLVLGLGRPGPDDPLFTLADATPWKPDYLSRTWRQAVTDLELPDVSLHALRHSHASALISAGVDVLTISRRLGHATAAFTLTVYGHLFTNTDAVAAKAIDMAFAAKPS
jgi:integrase